MEMSTSGLPDGLRGRLAGSTFFDALRQRRSRRFGLGMKMPGGPLAYQSRHQSAPLTEDEEAALAFAGCGVTGHALADLCYEPSGGGNVMAGLAGRVVSSGDGIQTVALAVVNDTSVHLLKRPQDFSAGELAELIELGRQGAVTECYRRSRVRFRTGRACPPTEPLFNINANRWSAGAAGSSYFLPINDVTLMYINGALEVFNEHNRAFVLDERANFRLAGVGRFARGKGGHLEDDPRQGRVATIELFERLITEFVTVEQGMMLQNLGLMAETLGLGGFSNFANHEFGWFEALGFRMGSMPASRYLGANWLVTLALNLLRRNAMVPYPLGLEFEGKSLLKPFCPPYYATMTEAVRAVVDLKLGPQGVFRGRLAGQAWSDPAGVAAQVPGLSESAIAAATAYCEYVWSNYGRFPAYLSPFHTVLGFQACHLDVEFYDRFYRPESLTQAHRDDFARQTRGQ